MTSKLDDTPAVPPVDDPILDAPPVSVPDTGDAGEGGKLKMIVQLVKKCLGVKDIASMRLSLPASLLEPIPNLEYSQYLDRPDIFAAINDSDDEFMRMLAVIRFIFTKDLKYVHGKVCKPYNSVLGEFFRAHWDIIPVSHNPSFPTAPPIPAIYTSQAAAASATPSLIAHSETASLHSGKSIPAATRSVNNLSYEAGTDRNSTSIGGTGPTGTEGKQSPSTAGTSPNLEAGMSNLSLASASEENIEGSEEGRVRIVYLTEQVSHHPPISAYYASCPSKHIEMLGIDQISAKVSGTTLRVAPGSFNKGIYVRLTGGPGEGEMYHTTHPTATVNGILRGSFYVTVGDTSIITCSKEGADGKEMFRAIIEYKEESWIGRAQYLLEGVIHTYVQGDTAHEAWTRVKHVPQSRVVAHIDGSWRHLIRWKFNPFYKKPSSSDTASLDQLKPSTSSLRASTSSSRIDIPATENESATLVDLSTLRIIPKGVRPLSKQLPRESRKLWQGVTRKLLKKEYGEATKEKVGIEQKQRDEAAERKRTGGEFMPQFFEKDLSKGFSELTELGAKAVEEELSEPSRYCLTLGEAAGTDQKKESENLEEEDPLL
jgi:hypothetical protein